MSTGPTPSAPPVNITDAPPSYSIAVKYPTSNRMNNGAEQNVCYVAANIDLPPPPYSPQGAARK